MSVLSHSIVSQGYPPENWFHLDGSTSEYNGMNIKSVYQNLLNGKKGEVVVVAVLDSGIDTEHEDLKDVIWVNADEIPGNQLDDDGNGYVDDIHGWNFIGSKDGQNITKETLEVTRLYGKMRSKYEGVDVAKLSKKEKKEYEQYLSYKRVVEKKRSSAQKKVDEIQERASWIIGLFEAAQKTVGDQKVDHDLAEVLIKNENEPVSMAGEVLKSILEQDLEEISLSELMEAIRVDFESMIEHYSEPLNYTYNPDFNSRAIIGDNYNDPNDRNYGNPDVGGGFSFHGTHVAGIIGAARGNEIGVDGIANKVRIMSLRVVPDGDEHDKDVANAIRYAVDNGAMVVNMSFGKGQSWDKKAVDEAVKYAMKNDVLLVHAAGNDGSENDGKNNYPNPSFEKSGLFGKKKAKNWLEVGASSYRKGQNMIAGFSNYGKTQVDIFAPGVAIYSTAPNNGYAFADGTSMASPVVAGTAALLRSYFPSLTACQVKEVLLESSSPIQGKVLKPGTYERVLGKDLSVSGGMLDAYAAVKLAFETKGKKKIKKKHQNRS
jgi:subtilisin family serine protease